MTEGVRSKFELAARRELESDEVELIGKRSKRWLPKLFRDDQTPLTDLLSSPLKMGLLAGALPGAIFAGVTSVLGRNSTDGTEIIQALRKLTSARGLRTMDDFDFAVAGAAALTAALPLLLGGFAYLRRRQLNENFLEGIVRNPRGATYRDYLSDPAIQMDQLRESRQQDAVREIFYPP